MIGDIHRILAGFCRTAGQRRGGDYVDNSIRTPISSLRIIAYYSLTLPKTAVLKTRFASQASRILVSTNPARIFESKGRIQSVYSKPETSADGFVSGGVAP